MEIISFEKRTFEEIAAKLDRFVQRVESLCREHGDKETSEWMDNLVVVHPFTCFIVAVFTAQAFHPLYKAIQLGGNLLESPFFTPYHFH